MKRFSVVAGILAGVALVVATALVGTWMWGTGNTAVSPPVAEYDDLATGSTGGAPASAPQPGVAQEAATVSRTDAAGGSGFTVQPDVDRLVVRNAALSMRVDDVDDSVAAIRTTAARHGARIDALTVTTGEPAQPVYDASTPTRREGSQYAELTLSVPVDRLDALEASLGDLGTVVSRTSSADDVTQQAIDLDARLDNLRAQEVRLREIMESADTVDELLKVEAELERIRGDIESLDAQLTYLKGQAARATLAVSLSEPTAIVGHDGAASLRTAFARGVDIASALVRAAVTALVPLALLAGIVVVVAIPIRLALRRKGRRDADSVPSPEQERP